jgi:hypothetical protein
MFTTVELIRCTLPLIAFTATVAIWAGTAVAGDDDVDRIRRAVAYLDARQDDWSRFASAQRGEGADRTS